LFEANIPFVTPFSWTQGYGNLLIDIRNDINPSQPVLTCDAHRATGVGYRMVAAFDQAAPTGFLSPDQIALCLRAATGATPLLYADQPPVVGTTYRVHLRQARPGNGALRLMGFSNTVTSGVPLPLSLAPFGAPLCEQLVSGDSIEFLVADGIGRATSLLAIPPLPSYYGLEFFNQFAVLDPAANLLGMTLTQGLALRVGLVQ
jgi:hypothetical protein